MTARIPALLRKTTLKNVSLPRWQRIMTYDMLAGED